MTDDFLTSPDDLPALRAFRRPLPRPDHAAPAEDDDAATDADGREPAPVPGATLAVSVVLVATMIALPAFGAVEAWSKTPGAPYRTF